MRRAIALIALCSALACNGPHAPSKGESPDLPLYTCHRASGAITIDGKLDDAAWNSAPWTSDFVDVRGKDYPAPMYRTRCKLLWDDKNLYLAAEMQDPQVWGTMTEQGSHLFLENNFEAFLDPAGNGQNYWELEINPLNTTWHLQMSKAYSQGGGPIPDKALTGLQTAVEVQGTLNNPTDRDQGWTAEIAIPWKSLTGDGQAPRDGAQWRMLLCRIEWPLEVSNGKYQKVLTGEKYWAWTPTGAINYHAPEKYGRLEFVK